MTDSSAQWPTTIGTIGIIIGIVLVLDNVDDLVLVWWTAGDWGQVFAPAIADLIARTTPSAGWRLVEGVVEVGLGTLLIVASLAVRRRFRRGIPLCRLWAWLAVAWTVVVMARSLVWISRHAGELSAVVGREVRGYAVFGLLLALVLLLAYPVFLLVWFSRPTVRAESGTWR
jgi:uncharacterized membrane protein HdeD (DUF308 family)